MADGDNTHTCESPDNCLRLKLEISTGPYYGFGDP